MLSINYLKNPPSNRFEVLEGESLTVPNQSMTIREVVSRSIRGQQVPVGTNQYYDGETDHDNVDPTLSTDFDLSDYTRIQNELRERQQEIEASAQAIEADAGTKDAEISVETSKKTTKDVKTVQSTETATKDVRNDA